MTRSVCLLVGRSVGSVCHDFLKGREDTLPCSYRSTYSDTRYSFIYLRSRIISVFCFHYFPLLNPCFAPVYPVLVWKITKSEYSKEIKKEEINIHTRS